MSETGEGFFTRWSRRKHGAAQEPAATRPEAAADASATPLPAPMAVAPEVATPQMTQAAPGNAPPQLPPSLEDVAALAPGAEVSRFIARDVDAQVQRAALKKLFADPHFNVMDGLDVYIDDYGKPDPIPLAMLRQMNQSKFLRLFDDEQEATAPAAPNPSAARAAADPLPPAQDAGVADAAAVPHAPDEDPDLQLQPDDAAGRPGADEGADGEPAAGPGRA
jgi:hypothetical protein